MRPMALERSIESLGVGWEAAAGTQEAYVLLTRPTHVRLLARVRNHLHGTLRNVTTHRSASPDHDVCRYWHAQEYVEGTSVALWRVGTIKSALLQSDAHSRPSLPNSSHSSVGATCQG